MSFAKDKTSLLEAKGHLGTNRKMDTPELQKKIKELAKKYSWSQEQLSRELYVQLHPDDENDDSLAMQRFGAALKKQLNRPTTSVATLQRYLDILIQDPLFEKENMVYTKPVSTTLIDECLANGISSISKKILKNL